MDKKASWEAKAAKKCDLEASWAVLAASWGVLEASWAVLEASWSVLEASWRRLGRIKVANTGRERAAGGCAEGCLSLTGRILAELWP